MASDPSPSARSGGQHVVDALRRHGVDLVFNLPGESFIPVLDALYDARNDIRLVSCRHEAAAATMAEAHGKLTGRPGICIVTRGPGATHASVGMHTAFQDSTPLILLIGQVERHALGREGFQEFDVHRLFGWTAKWTAEARNAAEIPQLLTRAFQIATSGRPGPVAISLPQDVLEEMADAETLDPLPVTERRPEPGALAKLHELLGQAERPLALVGGGGWTDEGAADIARFLERQQIPAAVTFRRLGLLPTTHPTYAGEMAYAPDPKLMARVREADLILALGTRLGEVVTQDYTLLVAPKPKQTLVHLHADGGEIGRVYQPALGIAAGLNVTAKALAALAPQPLTQQKLGWLSSLRAEFAQTREAGSSPGALDMNEVMATLREKLPADAIVCTDAGNFAQWPQRFLHFPRRGSYLGPAGGAMGYGLPAAIAASLTHPGRRVIGFSGDGGFLMTGSELATAMQTGAAPVILVVNNGMFGTIRAHQERHHPGRVMGTDLANPDFAAYARSFGAFGATVSKTADFAPALDDAFAAGRVALIELKIDPEALSSRATLSGARKAGFAAQGGHD